MQSIVTQKKLQKEVCQTRRGNIFTNSLKFGEEFGFPHTEILRSIRNLTMEFPIVKIDFIDGVFQNSRGREYPYFEMSRKGYMTLTMQMGKAKSKEARLRIFNKQQLFIDAFDKMEQIILRQQNQEWKLTREQGKAIRKNETDTIKEFIEYATLQGSKSAKMYYMNITKATYKALSLLEQNKPKTRDTLDLLELNSIILAEDLITRTIQEEMNNKEHYKAIYVICRNKLEEFAKFVNIKRIG